jgi:hypothetical protein
MDDKLERIRKEAVMAYSRYYRSICVEELKKTRETFRRGFK